MRPTLPLALVRKPVESLRKLDCIGIITSIRPWRGHHPLLTLPANIRRVNSNLVRLLSLCYGLGFALEQISVDELPNQQVRISLGHGGSGTMSVVSADLLATLVVLQVRRQEALLGVQLELLDLSVQNALLVNQWLLAGRNEGSRIRWLVRHRLIF